MHLAPRQLELFRAPQRRPLPEVREPAPSLEVAHEKPAGRDELVRAVPSRTEALASARVLAHALATLLGPEVKVLLSVHDNRSTMISFRREPPLLKLRVHHLFLEAPPDVVRAIADYAGRGHKKAGQVLDDYIADRQGHIRAGPRRATTLVTRGEHFDLL